MKTAVERVEAKAREIVSKAAQVLAEVPLCDRCLGRLFALLGRGLSNTERGRSLKYLVVASLHSLIREGDEEAKQAFISMAPNIGPLAERLYTELTSKPLEPRKCYICGSRLDEVINEAYRLAINQLKSMDISTFIVAAFVPDDIVRRENELKIRFSIPYSESIKAEIRREVSKLIQRHGYKPDFENPDVVVNVYFAEPISVVVEPRPLLYLAYYRKTARRISQSTWLIATGELKYPFSVELALNPLVKLLNGERVVLHAAGREDVDVRTFGRGRLSVIEVKAARRRSVELKKLEESVKEYSKGVVVFKFVRRAYRRDVEKVKKEAERHLKLYRALVVVEKPVDDKALRDLEEFFRSRKILQRTPRRVRHRRADVVRERTVHAVAVKRLGPNVFEALILADAGLYIKELVDGDGGDTTPSFAERLGMKAYCAELDVAYIIHEEL